MGVYNDMGTHTDTEGGHTLTRNGYLPSVFSREFPLEDAWHLAVVPLVDVKQTNQMLTIVGRATYPNEHSQGQV